MRFWKDFVLFYLGGCGYLGIELLYRGRTHGSMFTAGGLCFLLVGKLNRADPLLSRIPRAMLGAMVITMVELGVGLAVNRDYRVWEYRNQPGNLFGQICPDRPELFGMITVKEPENLYYWLDSIKNHALCGVV